MARARRLSGLGDEDLARLTRGGDEAAFGELWERHARAGLAAARQFASIADPDDIVSEAYLRILRALQGGGGPSESFRPYLYRTIRNVALGWVENRSPVPLEFADELEDPAPGPEAATIQSTITVRAFRTLPERWQTVLWYTEIEGMDPSEAAPLLGMTPNGVAALAYRAREGLRKAWLQAHVNHRRIPEQCRWTTERMGDYVRGALPPAARARFDAHLATCTRCPILLEEVDDLSGRLALLILPLSLGGAAATGLLATRNGGTADGAQARTVSPVRRPGRIPMMVAAAVAATLVVTGIVWAATLTPTPPVAVETESPQAPPASTPTPHPSGPAEPTSPAGPVAPPVTPQPRAPQAKPAPPSDGPGAPVIASPVPGTLTNDSTPTVTGGGQAGSTILVDYWDGTAAHPLGTALVPANGSWSLTPAVIPDGTWALRATQVRSGLSSGPAVTTLTVDTVAAPPVIAPLPAGPLLFIPTLTGTAEQGATVTVLTASGSQLTTAVAGSAGSWTAALPDAGLEGESVVAMQTDLAGNTSATSAPTAALQFAYPTLTPADGTGVPSTAGATVVTLEIDGFAGTQVEVFVDGLSTGNLHALPGAPIRRVTTALPDGPHTLGVRYVDGAGRFGPTVTNAISIAP